MAKDVTITGGKSLSVWTKDYAKLLPALKAASETGVIDPGTRDLCRAMLPALQADLAPARMGATLRFLSQLAKACNHPESGKARPGEIVTKVTVLASVLDVPATLLPDDEAAHVLLKACIRALPDGWMPSANWLQKFFDQQAAELRATADCLTHAANMATKDEAEMKRAETDPSMRLVLKWRRRFNHLDANFWPMRQTVNKRGEALVDAWLQRADTAQPNEKGWPDVFMQQMEAQHDQEQHQRAQARAKAVADAEAAKLKAQDHALLARIAALPPEGQALAMALRDAEQPGVVFSDHWRRARAAWMEYAGKNDVAPLASDFGSEKIRV